MCPSRPTSLICTRASARWSRRWNAAVPSALNRGRTVLSRSAHRRRRTARPPPPSLRCSPPYRRTPATIISLAITVPWPAASSSTGRVPRAQAGSRFLHPVRLSAPYRYVLRHAARGTSIGFDKVSLHLGCLRGDNARHVFTVSIMSGRAAPATAMPRSAPGTLGEHRPAAALLMGSGRRDRHPVGD